MAMLRPFLPARRRAGIPLGANAAASAQFPSFGEFCRAPRLDVAITGISIRACADAIILVENACIARGSCVARRCHLSGTRSRDQFFCQV